MKNHIAEFLICPECLPEETGLLLDAHEGSGAEVVEGVLRCAQCRTVFPIVGGTAMLGLHPQEVAAARNARYETPEIVSSYLWSHYADLFDDEDATEAYSEWAELFTSGEGIALDAGCAVGRFTFELSDKCDLAIGFDNSRNFIEAARRLLIERQLDFDLKEEGSLTEKRSIKLPEGWDHTKVEFIVADAQALPFRRHFFSQVASLNLVDKLPKPLHHLKEMNRTALLVGAQILVSDPFSWSIECANEEDWLGGRSHGAHAGKGLDNVQAILQGRSEEVSPLWTVQKRGNVWWKIRNHRNHFELIRSCYIKARR
jgi:SAM-dependent methyltransferase/uncharacterized protein YbaR (Trm112 family)